MAAPDLPHIHPVILSGGSGTRLWPLSRAALPKQFLRLHGDETMLAATARRVADRSRFHRPLVVTGAAHAALARETLPDDAALIVEPMARNTAAAIALATAVALADDAAALLLVMPSDHVIRRPDLLLAAVDAALPLARDGWLVTFGIKASGPDTGYGYIRAGDALAPGVRQAAAFVEKPPRELAETFVADGNYSWNSGLFLFAAAAMRAALAEHAPAILAAAEAALAAGKHGRDAWYPEASAFAAAPNLSIDHAVFEHAPRVAVAPVDPGWSDIGGWDALHAEGPADAEGNVASGAVAMVDTHDCLLRADGVAIAVAGVSGLNIVATPDAVLVTARGRGQDVKTLAGVLPPGLAQRPAMLRHPWGEERTVHDASGLPARLLRLDPGAEAPARGLVLLLDGDVRIDGVAAQAGEPRATDGMLASRRGATLLLVG
jgi:mannose-1-phosphate guanylyltransferase/mannose-1-phosphate guanylyltransferase/mannose-6-phosphate isomerase